VFIIDALLLVFFMGGIRLIHRTYQELWRLKPQKRLLIYGAGDAGELIVRDMKRYNTYDPVGFIDDNRHKVGKRIHGVKVLGTRADLSKIVTHQRPHEVLVAMPGADPETVRSIVKALEPFKMPIRTLPNIRDLENCRITVTEIRDLSIEDLLPRAPVGLDVDRIRDLVTNRRVLVTGAGGSIGSELCRQIAGLNPKVLVMYERYENSLYAIANDLEAHHAIVRQAIGDVTDTRRLNAVFEEYRPEIVFHAAAHKHVPLMELNVCEAVKNNVTGTRRVARAAIRHHVQKVVLISSDKAVNPSSVMGATKRVAEMIFQDLAARASGTQFVAVRFGNVLGSNGSVVPRFLQQIKAGGPVTVTHPDMQRFFMLIAEAVRLVLHAAAEGEDGALYVLDMGEQIKLLDMARNLIRLSGFVPDEEIPIVFTGPRPGEKLYEELVEIGEALEPSGVDKILRVRAHAGANPVMVGNDVTVLERYAARGDTRRVLEHLLAIVPSFTPVGEEPLADGPVTLPRMQPTDGVPTAPQPALAGGYLAGPLYTPIPVGLAASGFTSTVGKERE
jgi:FlaA1/EpsC-like NDP-sugar epimerase